MKIQAYKIANFVILCYDEDAYGDSFSYKQEVRIMRKNMRAAVLCLLLMMLPESVYAQPLNYTETLNTYETEGKSPAVSRVDDGAGNPVNEIACEDTLYLAVKDAVIRELPGEQASEIKSVLLGSRVSRTAVCDNEWSKIIYEEKGAEPVTGYLPDSSLSDQEQILKFTDRVTVASDSDVLDFPGVKDGEVIGEVLELDEVTRTGTIDDVWSRILFMDDEGEEQTGYIPTTSLEDFNTQIQVAQAGDTDQNLDAGVIHENKGSGVFSEAVDAIADEAVSTVSGVQVGTPIAVSSDASLIPLGTFRITHYCPCSICCGPWANGITSTGVTATTNHTIAVDPTQIPYGSRVVINGQVYVAEDCGGAIKTNCIDIYVATHEEGNAKGVYYTDVYLIQ